MPGHSGRRERVRYGPWWGGNSKLYQATGVAAVIGRKSYQSRNVDAELEQTFAQAGNPRVVVNRCRSVSDKDLTPPSSSCANICSQFVVPMARLHQRGFQDRGTQIGSALPVSISPLSLGLRIPSCFLAVSLFVAFFSFSPVRAVAQDGDVEDVHVAPRVDPEPADKTDVQQDTVRTHAPMIKSKVDLVLVPVTVTDPMNRLVTGLDKENFEVFEGKDRQDVRHFSAEDAPISLGVIFDMSGSMASKIERAREAVIEFLQDCQPAGRILSGYVCRQAGGDLRLHAIHRRPPKQTGVHRPQRTYRSAGCYLPWHQ